MQESELRIADLPTLRVTHEEPRCMVVVLHGFAMRPFDLVPFAHSLGVPAAFLFPEGPEHGALSEQAPPARAWWKIDPAARSASLARGPRDFRDEHPAGLPQARACLLRFLQAAREAAPGYAELPLVLCGFSQGGMLACDTFLRHSLDLAGLALLSSSRIAYDEWEPFLKERRATSRAFPPLFISHGRADDDLAFSAGEALRDCLSEAGAQPIFLEFQEGHAIPVVVWRGFRKFLLNIVQRTESTESA
ncbi:MAG: alpha/beta hydrolase [Myxococcota bacterium]